MAQEEKNYLRVDELNPGCDPLNIAGWAAGDPSFSDAQVFYAPDGQSAFVLFDIRDYSAFFWGAGMVFVMPGERRRLFDSGWRFEYKNPLFFQGGRYGYFYHDNISAHVRHAEHIFIRRGYGGYEYASLKVTGERNNHFAVSDDSVEGELEIFFYWLKGDKWKQGDKIRIDMASLPWVPIKNWR